MTTPAEEFAAIGRRRLGKPEPPADANDACTIPQCSCPAVDGLTELSTNQLIDCTSFGTPEARAHRAATPRDIRSQVLDQLDPGATP